MFYPYPFLTILYFSYRKKGASLCVWYRSNSYVLIYDSHYTRLNIFERVEFNKGVLLYKTFHEMCPEYLSNMFTFQSAVSYGLRSSTNQKMCIHTHKNELFKKSFQYSGAIVWNNLIYLYI